MLAVTQELIANSASRGYCCNRPNWAKGSNTSSSNEGQRVECLHDLNNETLFNGICLGEITAWSEPLCSTHMCPRTPSWGDAWPS